MNSNGYNARMQAEQDRKLALLAASIQRTLDLNTKFAFELKYGKINLN